MYTKTINEVRIVTNREIINDLFVENSKKGYKESALAFSFIERLKSKKRIPTVKDFQYVAELLKYEPKWAEINFKKYQINL